MAYKQKHQYGFRDSLEKGDPEKVIYGQYFDDEFKSIEEAIEAIDPDSDGNVDINEIDGLQDALDGKADKDHTHDEYLTDAPNDGKQYVRESEAWAEVTIPEAGIDEPTSDGKPYSRKVEGGQTVGAWVEAPTTDDIEYLDGRIDAIEGNISGGGGFIEAPDDGDDYARNGKSPAWVKTYNADYIDALEADYKNADAGKADAGHNHDSDYAPIDHTHTTDEITGLDDKIAEIEGDITDLEGAVGELTGQLALGGSYNASTGLVVKANLSSFTAGQPLPGYSTVPNTFVIVVEAGNNPEELGEGDWLVAGQSGWVAIKYGTAGSVDWDNITNVPDFDLVYAPIDHTHEIADVDGLQEALDAATGELEDGTVDGQITTWNASSGEWTPDDAVVVGANGDVGINYGKLFFSAGLSDGGGWHFRRNHTNGECYIWDENSYPYSGPLIIGTNNTEAMRIDANGRVGIGGEPGTRTAGEYLEQAKEQIASWKAEVKKRTAEQPEASTQEITLEVTDGDFGVMPTADVLAEKLAERTIGGGSAKLQVAGDGFVGGMMLKDIGDISLLYKTSAGGNGIMFHGSQIKPSNNVGGTTDGVLDIGDPSFRFKDAHFSGTVNASNFAGGTFGTGDACIEMHPTHLAVLPVNAAGSARDNTISIGRTGMRFKDAHFSGTIYGKVADVPDHVKAITPTQIANWDAGTGGGGGGATTDGRISDTQILHWDQAYSWGNHASAGYQPAGNYLTPSSLTGYATESWVNSQGFAKGSFVPTSGNSTISGTLTATDFVATSDARLKQNATTAPVGLVDQLRGVEFEWKEDGRQDAGVIAQEVEKVLPHLVHDTGEHKAVNYNGLVAYLIEEIKDLKAQVEALK